MKRMRSDAKKSTRNQAALSELKTLAQKLWALENEPEKAREFSVRVIRRYDQAVNRRVIPRGRADRKKARIARFLASLKK